MSNLKRRLMVWVTVLTLILGISAGVAGATSERDHLFTRIQTVFEVVERYHRSGADIQAFVDGAIRGGLEALGDPYTNYFPPTEFADFMASLDGNLSGIGVYLELQENYVVVAAPIKGTPAHEAGLQTGDRILEANGVPLVGAPMEKATSTMRGEAGTEVLLKVERPSENRTFEVKIVRAVIHIPQVEFELLEDGVGYLALSSFGSTAAQEFYAAVDALKEQGATSLVLDLRQNPGGYTSAAIDIASAWVPQGEPVMYEVGRDDEDVLRSKGTPINLPTAVLVDGGSASSTEILAGAIQDYQAGTLVGTQTFGKGTVQQILFMSGGAGMKVTIAEYLTGKRHKVDGVGLTPDYTVEMIKPDPAIAQPFAPTRILGMNGVGMDVLDLQNRLVFLGYDPDTDGTFRGRTMKAVNRFQTEHGLSAAPIVDSSFAAALNEAMTERLKEREDMQLKKAIELLTNKGS